MNVTPRNPEKYILATATAILRRLSLETHDKHDGAQVKESVLPYLTRTQLGARNEVEPASDDIAQGFTQRYTHSERLEHFISILIRAINASSPTLCQEWLIFSSPKAISGL